MACTPSELLAPTACCDNWSQHDLLRLIVGVRCQTLQFLNLMASCDFSQHFVSTIIVPFSGNIMKCLLTFVFSLISIVGLRAANPSFRDLVFTNSAGTISNRVSPAVSNFVFNSSVPLTNPTASLVSFSNNSTNRLVITPNSTIMSDEMYITVGQSNYLVYDPGAADSVTPYTWNTSEFHTSGYLFDFLNKNTNVFSINPDGGLTVGRNSYFGTAAPGTALLSYRNTATGDVDFAQILLGSVGAASTVFSEIDSELASTYANVYCKTRNGAASTITTAFLITSQGDSEIGITASGAIRTDFHPTVADGQVPYSLDTSLYHASGLLLKIDNFATNIFSVDFAGNESLAGANSPTNGTYYHSNTFTVASISAGMTNGAFWVGTLSNSLQAVWMSNNVTLFKRLAP